MACPNKRGWINNVVPIKLHRGHCASFMQYIYGVLAAFHSQRWRNMNICSRKNRRATVFACICLFVYIYIHELSVSNVCNVLQGIICILYACLWCESEKAFPQRLALAKGEFILIRAAALSRGTDNKRLK